MGVAESYTRSISLPVAMILAGCTISLIGQRYNKKNSLAVLYLLRGSAILILLLLPKTGMLILVFAALMGILWLSTIPLTSGIVAQLFGVRYLGTLFGIVFLGHQVGSFLGVWLGGYIHDIAGSYEPMWWTAMILSLVAAALHIPIHERPLQPGPLPQTG